MIEASVMLLSEWDAYWQKTDASWQSEMNFQIFGSFLDRQSLELVWIIANDPFEKDNLNQKIAVQLVFLPICRSYLINQDFKQEVQQLIQMPITFADLHYNPAIPSIVNHALEVVNRMRRLHHAQLMDILIHPRLHHTPKFLENRILFGNRSAQFLSKISLLPQVRVNQRVYNGIPFGLDLSSFVHHIVRTELLEQVRMQQLLPVELLK
jgi:hypothetical protein